MDQDARAIQALPPERVVREAVVLAPAELGREKVLQAGLLDELRQAPGISKDVGQPEHRRPSLLAKMPLKEGHAQQELPDQGLTSGEVAVGLDPGTAHRLPPACLHLLPDGLKESRIVLADHVV